MEIDTKIRQIFRICTEMLTNVIDRQNKDRALFEEKERLSITLRSIADGVIATDLEGNIILMNQAAEDITDSPMDRR